MERFTETSGECRLFEECDRAEGGKGRQER